MPRLESRLGGHAAEPGRAVLEFAERHSGRRSESLLHNANGNETESFNADGNPSATAYDPDGRSYCAIDPVDLDAYLTAHSTRLYPYSCPAYTATVPLAGSDPGYTFSTYNDTGNVLTTSNQLGDTETTAYDGDGNPTTATNADGDKTTTCYYHEYAMGECPVWKSPKSIDSTRSISSISCAAAETCVAVDSTGHAITESAGSWSSAAEHDSTRDLTSISCPSTTFWMAVDSTGHAVKDSAGTWTSSSIDSSRESHLDLMPDDH